MMRVLPLLALVIALAAPAFAATPIETACDTFGAIVTGFSAQTVEGAVKRLVFVPAAVHSQPVPTPCDSGAQRHPPGSGGSDEYTYSRVGDGDAECGGYTTGSPQTCSTDIPGGVDYVSIWQGGDPPPGLVTLTVYDGSRVSAYWAHDWCGDGQGGQPHEYPPLHATSFTASIDPPCSNGNSTGGWSAGITW